MNRANKDTIDKDMLLMEEEAQEVERDILEHEVQETGVDSKNNMSFNIPEMEKKGYTLQQAYRKIGGMGKLFV